jgi:hypothetical protein
MASNEWKSIKEYPELGLSGIPKNFKYRYNWNAPIISSPHDRSTIYHAGNVVFKTQDGGTNWEVVSPDLTRNDTTKQGPGGRPYTIEAAGGENYNTIMYLVESPHEQGVLWAGSDDGLVHLTRDGGTNWTNVTPSGLPESIINSIEVSPHDPATAYITVMRYKFNDLTPMAYKTEDYGASWTRITSGLDDPNGFVRTIRADEKVKGLLYAGTETGLYVSYNDGANWQQLQLNLPVLPINDLIIQDNDLVAATAGRGFWILDDLSAIQQSKGEFGTNAQLYQPKDTYLIRGGTSDNPTLGKNPPSGVTFDYYLSDELPDSISLAIEILESDMVIRTYSSQKDESFKSWPGGPPRPIVAPAKKGINRFTWDFRRATLPAVDKVFVFGDIRGTTVGPGEYTIRLSVEDGDTLETNVTIKANPKIDASNADYAEQQATLKTITAVIVDIHEKVNDMRSAKAQLKSYQKLLKGNEDAKTLLDTSKSLIKKISTWEENLIQPKQKTFQDVINFQNQLNAQLTHLKGYVDQADPRVTQGAKDRLKDLVEQWRVFADQRNQLIDVEMTAFNDLYKSLDLPAIILKE